MRRRSTLGILVVSALLLSGTALVGRAPAQVASPPPPVATVVSISDQGQVANANASHPRLSGDGRHVVFVTAASNLVDAPGQGSHYQVVVHELATRRNRLGSVNADGRAGNAGIGTSSGSSNPFLSADGRYVAFDSRSTDLVPGDNNRAPDVFVKDMESSGGAVRVSVTSTGAETTRLYGSQATGISEDGRYVSFTSAARNLDNSTQTYEKLYVHDRQTGATTLASFPNKQVSGWATISADGHFAVWSNWGQSGGSGRPCPSGTWYDHGIFMRDLTTGEVVTIASQPTRCTSSYGMYMYPSISTDGRLVAYVYIDPAAPAQQRSQIYLYDRLSGTSSLVSADATGAPSNLGSTFPRLSGDGRSMAFFSASTNLVSDPVTATSFFKRDMVTGEFSVIRLTTDTSVPGWGSLSDFSHDGRRIAFGAGTATTLRAYVADYDAGPTWTDAQLKGLFGYRFGVGYASDPVNTATGNFTTTVRDLGFPETVFGLDWTRTYNSLDTTAGPLGAGWTGGFAATVTEQPGGDVELRDGDGRVVTFRSRDGGYDRPPDLPADLTRGADGRFSIRYVGGTSATFDADGRLARRDRWDGQAVDFAYDAAGRLTTAASSTGQTLGFTYDADGRVTEASAADGRRVTYAYQQGRLHQVREPDGGVTTYDTDDAGRILRITGPDQRLVLANAYDQHGRVAHQDTPSGDRVDFAYEDISNLTVVKNQATGGSVTFSHDLDGRLTGIVDPYGKVVRRSFDADGNLVSIVDRRTNAASQQFDTDGQVTRRVLPGGATETFDYDGAGRLVRYEDPAGALTELAYEGGERLPSTVTRSGGTTRVDVQDGLVRSVEDADGVEQRFTYDAARNLVAASTGAVPGATFGYDAAGRRTSATLPGGATSSYEYDPDGRVVRETAPDGGVTSYTYDAAGRLTSATNPAGAETRYAYDSAGQLASRTSPTGEVTTYTYDAAGRPAVAAGPGDTTTETTFDKLGALLSVRSPTGAETSFAYDADGNLTETTDPNGAPVTDTVDALGRVTERKDALGRATTYEYDARGLKVAEVDPAGGRTTYGYDDDGRLTRITDPRGAVTERRYSPAGRILAVKDPLGGTTTFDYDEAGRPVTVTDPGGQVTTHGYDAAGRRTSTTTAGETTRYGYDAAGRPTTVTDPRGGVTTTSYDSAGRVVRAEDPTGAARSFTYDQAGRLTAATDPNGATTRYSYDERGNLSGRTDARSGQESFGYDDDDRSTSYLDPLSRRTSFAYDDTGRVTKVTDPSGRSVRLAYDLAGQLRSRTYGNGAKVSYVYDAAGRRTSMTDATGTTTFRFDEAGNLTRVTQPGGRWIGYAYDLAGRRSQMTYPDGSTVDYTYDPAGRLTRATHSTAGSATFTYDEAGRLATEELPGGVTRAYGYQDGLLTSFQEHGSGNDRSTSLAYDEAARISSETTDGVTRQFTYDTAGQLLSARVDGGAEEGYSYDEAGNLRTTTRQGTESTFTYDAAHQLVSRTTGGDTVTYTYDTAGRRVKEENGATVRAIQYDHRGLAVKVTTTEGGTTRTQDRSYDGDVALVSVSDDDGQGVTTTALTWDRAAPLPQVATMTSDGADTDLVYGQDRAFAVRQGEATAFSRDVYGSALRTPATAELVRADGYDAGGLPVGATGHGPAFGYRGELDLDGLLHLRARDYDPATAAFTSIDPLDGRPGDVGEANPYPYAANDPVNRLDPFGLSPIGNGELRLVGMMASWPGSMDWHMSKQRQFGGLMLWSRGNRIPADCLIMVKPCFNGTGGFEPEATAKAHAIRELSNRRLSIWNRLNPLDAPVSDAVHWEVQVPGTKRLADIVVDDNPDDIHGDIYEGKRWVGERTYWLVEVQLVEYINSAYAFGPLLWVRGRELTASNWAVSYEGPPEPGNVRQLFFPPRWVAWAPYAGHLYFAKWNETPLDVQVRAKSISSDPAWFWERLGVPSIPPVRAPAPVVV